MDEFRKGYCETCDSEQEFAYFMLTSGEEEGYACTTCHHVRERKSLIAEIVQADFKCTEPWRDFVVESSPRRGGSFGSNMFLLAVHAPYDFPTSAF